MSKEHISYQVEWQNAQGTWMIIGTYSDLAAAHAKYEEYIKSPDPRARDVSILEVTETTTTTRREVRTFSVR